MDVAITDGKLSGKAESRTRAIGLMASAGLGGIGLGTGVKFVVQKNTIQVSLHGLTGKGKLESRTRSEDNAEAAARVVTKDIFIVIETDLASIEVMEIEEGKALVHKLQKAT